MTKSPEKCEEKSRNLPWKTIWLTLLLPFFDFLQQKKYIDGETIILFTGVNDNKCILSMKPSLHKC